MKYFNISKSIYNNTKFKKNTVVEVLIRILGDGVNSIYDSRDITKKGEQQTYPELMLHIKIKPFNHKLIN